MWNFHMCDKLILKFILKIVYWFLNFIPKDERDYIHKY
jgi:hypothetical protein